MLTYAECQRLSYMTIFNTCKMPQRLNYIRILNTCKMPQGLYCIRILTYAECHTSITLQCIYIRTGFEVKFNNSPTQKKTSATDGIRSMANVLQMKMAIFF